MTQQLRRQVHLIGRRRAWAIWAAGLSLYVLAVFFRTSLGVAGILAADRFGISASQLATFTVLQLTVYAAMQIPVGVLLDRFGSKPLMIVGLALMTLGMTGFALAQSYPAGLAARVCIGVGDAMIFTSQLRLVALWFRVKQAPLLTQMTGMIGQVGAIAAATPLSLLLRGIGWERAFGASAALGAVLFLPLLLIVKSSPYAGAAVERIKLRALASSLHEVWVNPGTRAGLYSHFTAQFAPTVFTMLWGFPFLVAGEGLDPSTASNLLILMTLSGIVAGPLIARLTSHLPYYRTLVVGGVVVTIMTIWTVVLALPHRAPLWLLAVLVIVTAVGGPGSMIGFDVARSFHAEHRFGRASGLVNIGGFIASLITMALIGIILDRLAPGGADDYTLNDFRVAFCAMYLIWGFGLVQLWRYRRRGLQLIANTPGAMEALRSGNALLPGLSRDLEDR